MYFFIFLNYVAWWAWPRADKIQYGGMSEEIIYPVSPKDEIEGIPYFARMCHKIRLERDGELHADYQSNLGGGFGLWICQFLTVEYTELVKVVRDGASDAEALQWAKDQGAKLESPGIDWWLSYMRNRGYADDLAEILEKRKIEAGFGNRDDIASFFDFIDADEGRLN